MVVMWGDEVHWRQFFSPKNLLEGDQSSSAGQQILVLCLGQTKVLLKGTVIQLHFLEQVVPLAKLGSNFVDPVMLTLSLGSDQFNRWQELTQKWMLVLFDGAIKEIGQHLTTYLWEIFVSEQCNNVCVLCKQTSTLRYKHH